MRVASDLVHYVPFVGTELRALLLGGSTIGQSTLLRFYVLHVAVLTIVFFLLIAVHIWRVRKDGFAVARGGAPPWAVADGAPVPESRGERPDTPYPAAPDERVRLLGVVERTGVEREPPRPLPSRLTAIW